jgi:hypothetical protein
MVNQMEDINKIRQVQRELWRLLRKTMKAQGHDSKYLDEHLGGLFYGITCRISKIEEMEMKK